MWKRKRDEVTMMTIASCWDVVLLFSAAHFLIKISIRKVLRSCLQAMITEFFCLLHFSKLSFSQILLCGCFSNLYIVLI